MSEFFLSALSFGLAAGLKPGPLGVIVIRETLSRGLAAGARASLAPLVTDGPILLAAFVLLSRAEAIEGLVVALGLGGGAYLLWLSLKTFRMPPLSVDDAPASGGSLGAAVAVNLVNPGPYLFWFTVGGSYLIRGSPGENVVFVATAIGALIAAKLAVAVLAARFLASLEGRGYRVTMRLLAAALAWFGVQSIVRAVASGPAGMPGS